MTRAAITAILIILGVAAYMQPTARPYTITQTSSRHVRGTPYPNFQELRDP